ncbi:MAG: nicotinamide-nucleotide adenylyltransferase [Candidatus Micrarchaeia archaeon]
MEKKTASHFQPGGRAGNGKKPVALFIGRFQPFHKGHLSAVRWIAKKSGSVLVVIGSAQNSFEPKNPFSAAERKRMVKAQLASASLGKKCRILTLNDVNDNAKWATHVDAHVPRYDIVYSNNPLVVRLMRKAGKTVRALPFFKKRKYEGKRIRVIMKEGEKWQDRVPPKVRLLLKKLKGEERIRGL